MHMDMDMDMHMHIGPSLFLLIIPGGPRPPDGGRCASPLAVAPGAYPALGWRRLDTTLAGRAAQEAARGAWSVWRGLSRVYSLYTALQVQSEVAASHRETGSRRTVRTTERSLPGFVYWKPTIAELLVFADTLRPVSRGP